MPSQAPPPRIPEGWVVALLAAGASLAALLFYLRQDSLLLYGDAVAHLHIARRVIDGCYPGPFQLGTVWLPLPHILLLPFVAVDWMYRTGVAGSVVSMASYVLGTVGVFRLVRGAVAPESASSRVAPWLGAAVFALNPNLLYLRTTAMTEPLYLALCVWTVVFVAEFAQQAREGDAGAGVSLERTAMVLSGAMLTRYDGWFLAAATGPVVLWVMWKVRSKASPALKRCFRNFLLLAALTPALWLAYNFGQYGRPLEFLTGAYSTRAIEQRSAGGHPLHPGAGSLPVAALYFWKAALLNLGPGRAAQGLMLAAVLGALLCLWRKRRAPLHFALAAPGLLCAFGGLWRSTDLRAGVVAIFLQQPALRDRASTRSGGGRRTAGRELSRAGRARPSGGDRLSGGCQLWRKLEQRSCQPA